MNRLRQTLLFERLLVRIFETLGDRAVAKGGVALELRLQRARTTKDLDLMLRGCDDGLSWPDLSAVFDAARRFLDPVLAGRARQWEPASWTWRGE